MTAVIYVLKHRACGHVAMAGSDRNWLTAYSTALPGGHRPWRIRAATDDDLTDLLLNRSCATCRLKEARGHPTQGQR